MTSNRKTGRITGVLLLCVFISGIIIFQFLQGPILFSDNYLTVTSNNANVVISSVVLGIFSGMVSIFIATFLLPVFKQHHFRLAYLYLAFCIVNFIAIMIDNFSVVSMLELSKAYIKGGATNSLDVLGSIAYEKHFWTHYFYLLISCFPVFVLYYLLYLSNLVPKVISVFGIFAVTLMFIEELCSIFGHGIRMNMLLPIGLIKLILPLWLIVKGFNSPKLKSENQLKTLC